MASFRVFNLGKLAKGLKNRKDFARIVNMGLGKQLFTFKTYFMENGRNEIADDLCFHGNNYEGVQGTLNTGRINALLEKHSDAVKKALKKFGILNHDFTDYRDPRLEYILNVLLNDLRSSISVNEYIEIRNFASLRECLLKVDRILDPTRIHAHDVISAINEGQLVSATDIASTSLQLSVDLVAKWATEENLIEHKIWSFDHNQTRMFVPVDRLGPLFRECHDLLRNKPETVAAMRPTQKEMLKRKADALYAAGRQIFTSAKFTRLVEAAGDADAFKLLLDDYDQYLLELTMRNQSRNAVPDGGKKGIISRLLGFFGSLFGGSDKGRQPAATNTADGADGSSAAAGAQTRPVNLTKDARQILAKIMQRKDEVIPLSDYIVLNRENDHIIDSIITDLRNGEIKIVVPVYNARDVLYPKRSAKLLIADIEYLIIPAHVIKAPEFISRLIDSHVVYKLKDDIVGSKALIAIERYLKTVHRQKRAIMMKKEMKQ